MTNKVRLLLIILILIIVDVFDIQPVYKIAENCTIGEVLTLQCNGE